MIKKGCVLLFLVILLSTIVLAQNNILISPLKESYSGNENITLKISVYNSQNNPVNAQVHLIINDSGKTVGIEKIVQSNQLVDINLGENAPAGLWKVSARYTDPSTNKIIESSSSFAIQPNELAKFELNEDNLTVTNIGNTPYSRTIDVLIGDTSGTKRVENLGVGEKISFRLSAPDGLYNVKIYDGTTMLTREKVSLTGEVIGILDERISTSGSTITGGIGTSSIFKSSFIYIFVLTIFITAILLAIERKYKRKLGK